MAKPSGTASQAGRARRATRIGDARRRELYRLALIHAIDERDAAAEADSGESGQIARQEAEAFRALLLQDYGQRPPIDVIAGNVRPICILEAMGGAVKPRSRARGRS